MSYVIYNYICIYICMIHVYIYIYILPIACCLTVLAARRSYIDSSLKDMDLAAAAEFEEQTRQEIESKHFLHDSDRKVAMGNPVISIQCTVTSIIIYPFITFRFV